MRVNSINIGFRKRKRRKDSFSWSSYWKSRLDTWYYERSGNDLLEKNDLPAKILVPCLKVDSTGAHIDGDKTRHSERLWDGGSYTLYFKFDILEDAITTGFDIEMQLFIAGSSATVRGMDIYGNYGNLRLSISDGTTRLQPYIISDINTALKGKGTFEFFGQVDYANKLFKCNLFNSDGTIVGTEISQDISSFVFNDDANNMPFKFMPVKFATSMFKKFSALKTIEQCRNDSYVTDLQIFIPNHICGTDVSGNAQHFGLTGLNQYSNAYLSQNSWSLDHGYTKYVHDTLQDLYVPNNTLGSEVVVTPYTGYTKSGDTIEGDLTAHNLHPSRIGFNPDGSADAKLEIFDRSNETRQTAVSRASDHYTDTSLITKCEYDISEIIDPRVYFTYFNVGYKGRIFSKIELTGSNITKLFEILNATTDQLMNSEWKAFTYCGIDYFAVLDDDGNWTYDENGYIVIE